MAGQLNCPQVLCDFSGDYKRDLLPVREAPTEAAGNSLCVRNP